MATMTPILESKLRRDLNAEVSVIVRLNTEPAAHLADVLGRGLLVRHTYELISAIAVQGKASAMLSLGSEPWVVAIEEDKTIHTL
jgi:hypothetical protein